MQVPGSASRLSVWQQRWAGVVLDSIPDAPPRFRAKLLPLPVTCLVVASISGEPPCIHTSRDPAPLSWPRPPLPLLPPVQGLSTSAWPGTVVAAPVNREGEPPQYQSARFGIRRSLKPYESEFLRKDWLDSQGALFFLSRGQVISGMGGVSFAVS